MKNYSYIVFMKENTKNISIPKGTSPRDRYRLITYGTTDINIIEEIKKSRKKNKKELKQSPDFRANRLGDKYELKVIDYSVEENYILVEDEEGYQYETKYYGLSRFRKGKNSLTKESYIRKYIKDNKLANTKYKILDIENNKINILNTETNISVWQPKYKFNKKAIDSLTEKHIKYIDMIKYRFGDKYDYSKLEYTGSKSDATLICPHHGEFKVNWGNLINHNHQGCTKCTYTQRRFGRKGFIENCRRLKTEGILYILKFNNEDEEFYKIGITSNIHRRLTNFPYNAETVYVFSGDPGDVYDLEKLLHKKFTSDLYIPNIKFNGYLECFKFKNKEESLNIILDFSTKLLKLLIN